jgi:hypothetical protein
MAKEQPSISDRDKVMRAWRAGKTEVEIGGKTLAIKLVANKVHVRHTDGRTKTVTERWITASPKRGLGQGFAPVFNLAHPSNVDRTSHKFDDVPETTASKAAAAAAAAKKKPARPRGPIASDT